MIKVSQSTKRGFSKKTSLDLKNYFLFWDRMNPLYAWEGKLEVASFLTI
jgi:hypothetical protein